MSRDISLVSYTRYVVCLLLTIPTRRRISRRRDISSVFVYSLRATDNFYVLEEFYEMKRQLIRILDMWSVCH